MTAEQILVIILSATLAVFLILSLALVIITIKVVRSISRVTKKAEETTENLSGALKMAGRRAIPAAISAVMVAAVQRWGGKKGDRK